MVSEAPMVSRKFEILIQKNLTGRCWYISRLEYVLKTLLKTPVTIVNSPKGNSSMKSLLLNTKLKSLRPPRAKTVKVIIPRMAMPIKTVPRNSRNLALSFL